ncbi:cytochrome c family protein [Falsirhodobacter sp. alg1]|uniref:c-type cytochrome n=1 Tax=Falsirhodobacter sp. alg1 TaxID=1472418 RepID=UPI0005EF6380|nr:cytochrome c family protein [Falsirhodobacter sp. alg1]
MVQWHSLLRAGTGIGGAVVLLAGLNWTAALIFVPRAVGDADTVVTASTDPAEAAGSKVFARCHACHAVDNSNGIGPHLNGVVGRPAASVEGFAYSNALQRMEGAPWTPERLEAFLTNPRGFAPGTKMAFAGLPREEDRKAIIAYLETVP